VSENKYRHVPSTYRNLLNMPCSVFVWQNDCYIFQPVRSAYQPLASSTFLSEQTSHQQSASSIFLSEQISTSHQPPAKRIGCLFANISEQYSQN
jgi:hypothetical protein